MENYYASLLDENLIEEIALELSTKYDETLGDIALAIRDIEKIDSTYRKIIKDRNLDDELIEELNELKNRGEFEDNGLKDVDTECSLFDEDDELNQEVESKVYVWIEKNKIYIEDGLFYNSWYVSEDDLTSYLLDEQKKYNDNNPSYAEISDIDDKFLEDLKELFDVSRNVALSGTSYIIIQQKDKNSEFEKIVRVANHKANTKLNGKSDYYLFYAEMKNDEKYKSIIESLLVEEKVFLDSKEPKITAENIAEFYPAMSDEEKIESANMLTPILSNRYDEVLKKLKISPLTSRGNEFKEFRQSDFHKWWEYHAEKIELEFFGIKDNLQPIDQYIAKIKASPGYLVYVDSKEPKDTKTLGVAPIFGAFCIVT